MAFGYGWRARNGEQMIERISLLLSPQTQRVQLCPFAQPPVDLAAAANIFLQLYLVKVTDKKLPMESAIFRELRLSVHEREVGIPLLIFLKNCGKRRT